MKFKHYLLVFLVSFTGSLFLASCLNEENRIPPNCYDGILNNGESGELNDDGNPWDCGGPCEPCDHCANGVRDDEFGETWIDCGGECGPCSLCNNGILDPGEIGIDCGGPNCGDCTNLCNNGLLDGQETEVDCGSVYCDACPTCTDGEINGGEIGIDCGNGECPNCESAANCINGSWQQSSELYKDCGGPDCYDCDTLMQWTYGGDTYVVMSDNVVFSADATSIDIVGTADNGDQMAFSFDVTPGSIVNGTTVAINPESTGDAAAFNNGGLPFLHSFEGAQLNVSIGLARFNWNPGAWTLNQENIIVGSFSGTLVDGGGDEINITGGSFQISW